MSLRYLDTPSLEHVRLGWLRVIAAVVGASKCSLDELATKMGAYSTDSARWALSLAKPHGAMQVSRADRFARMGVTYRIYDIETSTLTDLGHVLRIAAPWDGESTPFKLAGAGKWVLFRSFMGAAGDVANELLQMWPRGGARGDGVGSLLKVALSALSRRSPADQPRLDELAERADSRDQRVRVRVTYPYLEPLVDLGYLRHASSVGGQGGYVITEAGERLKQALGSLDNRVESWLQSGLARAFLLAEGVSEPKPAGAAAVRDALLSMPDELRANASEVPLDAAAVLTQALLRVDAPDRWMDPLEAAARIREVGRASAGRIFLKRGLSTSDLNVGWTDAAVLTDSALWFERAPDEPMPSAVSVVPDQTDDTLQAVDEAAISAVEARSAEEPQATLEASAPEEQSPAVVQSPAVAASEPEAPVKVGLTVNNAVDSDADTSVSAQPVESVGQAESEPSNATDAREPPSPGNAETSRHIRLWLDFMLALVAAPAPGAELLFPWGGVQTGITRLRKLLELPDNILAEKRKPDDEKFRGTRDDVAGAPATVEPPKGGTEENGGLRQDTGRTPERRSPGRAAYPNVDPGERASVSPPIRTLHACREVLKALSREEDAKQIFDIWGGDDSNLVSIRIEARARLHILESTLPEIQRGIVQRIRTFLETSPADFDWPEWTTFVAPATRILVHDALSSGRFRADALRGAVGAARSEDARSGAARLLESLMSEPRDYRCIQWARVDPRDLEEWDLARVDGHVEGLRVVLSHDEPEQSHRDIMFQWPNIKARNNDEAERLARASTEKVIAALEHERSDVAWSLAPIELLSCEVTDVALVDLESSPISPADKLVTDISVTSKDYLEGPGPKASARRRSSFKDIWKGMETGRDALPKDHVRVFRARNGIFRARAETRNPGERLVLGWYALEQIFGSTPTAIHRLAMTIAREHLRAEMARTYRDAVRALCACALSSDRSAPVWELVGAWWSPLLALRDIPPTMRRNRANADETLKAEVSDHECIERLLKGWKALDDLRDGIELGAPLAANALHRFCKLMGAKEPRKPLSGDGKELAKHFHELYRDVKSFLYLVYELRNRHVHEGEGFDAAHDPAVPEVAERFLELAETVVLALKRAAAHGITPDLYFAIADARGKDLASLKTSRLGERLLEILASDVLA